MKNEILKQLSEAIDSSRAEGSAKLRLSEKAQVLQELKEYSALGEVIYRSEGLKEAAGEWGHHTINYNDGADWRTGKGAIEAYISGTGAQMRYKELFGDNLVMADIVYNFRKKEANAVAFMDYFLDHLGISIANLIKFLDPHAIVLGGGLSNIDEIYELLPNYIAKYGLNNDCYTPILKNEYGDSAGVYGAAIIGIQ